MTNTESWSVPINYPSLLGVYLAANAIPDAYVLVDGPDCALYKAHFIHGRHDWNSTLLNVNGRHRVAFTNVCSRGVVSQHDEIIARHIKVLDGLEESRLVLVTALPMCSITGVDYGRVVRGMGGLTKAVIDIPPSSLIGDWLDGYGQALYAVAKATNWKGAAARPGAVAVVGYLMDRNEADHAANQAELRRMLGALSLELTGVWPGGEPFAQLAAAREASVIVSLPYGRRAAAFIAEQTGAKLIEAELPFGLPKTELFLRRIAEETGKRAELEAFHAAEMRRVARRMEWALPYLFLNKRVVFTGDPHLLDGFLDIAEDTGMNVRGTIVTGRPAHGGGRDGVPVLHEPAGRSQEVTDLLSDGLDLVVSCHQDEWKGDLRRAAPLMEFGFPSYRHHVFFEQPFLGYNGFLAFVERMAGHLQARRCRCTA